MRKGMLLAVLLWPGLVGAQTVIMKCVDAKGAVVYQTEPCDTGQRMDVHKVYSSLSDSPRAAQQLKQAQVQQARQSQMHGTGQAHVIRIDGRENPSACDAAKAHRAARLEAVGLRRTYDLITQLDDYVRRACR